MTGVVTWIVKTPAPYKDGSDTRSPQSVSKELPASGPAGPSGAGPFSEEFGSASDLSVADRVNYWSRYVTQLESAGRGENPLRVLGRGPMIEDTVPLIPNRFDCTTYVETIAALARSDSAKDFFNQLITIRYRNGDTTFTGRNHFPELDWIPNNVGAGVIEDISEQVARSAGIPAHVATKEIDRERWIARHPEAGQVQRRLAADSPGPVTARLSYVALADVDKVLPHLPDGLVINLVREDRPERDVLVSHQGILIREGGQIYFRHASRKGRIQTLPLRDYLRKQNYRTWPLVGINLNRVLPRTTL